MSDELSRLLHRAADDVPDQPDRYRRVERRRAELARRRRRVTALAGVVLLAGAAAALSLTLRSPQESLVASSPAPATSVPARPTPSAVPATPTYPAVDVATACPDVPPVHLPPALAGVTRAYVCSSESRAVPGDGTWSFTVVRGVTGGLSELLSAWSAPDDTAPVASCAAILYSPLQVWLAGTPVVPIKAPTDACGKPTEAAQSAYGALTTLPVSDARGQQESTELSLTSGCSDQYKDLIELFGTDEAPRSTSEAPRPLTPRTRVCAYQVQADADGDRIGRLTSSRALTPEQVDRINTLLPGATPGRGCSITQHTRFALLVGEGTTTLMALDGCALLQDGTVWRTTDQLRAQVR